jgi:hypothetical protein
VQKQREEEAKRRTEGYEWFFGVRHEDA